MPDRPLKDLITARQRFEAFLTGMQKSTLTLIDMSSEANGPKFMICDYRIDADGRQYHVPLALLLTDAIPDLVENERAPPPPPPSKK
jgi:hypothetical protein